MHAKEADELHLPAAYADVITEYILRFVYNGWRDSVDINVPFSDEYVGVSVITTSGFLSKVNCLQINELFQTFTNTLYRLKIL